MLGLLYVDQSHLVETCPETLWEWQQDVGGGNLSIKYRTKKKAGEHNY